MCVLRAKFVRMCCVPGLVRQERRHCLGIVLLDLGVLSPGDRRTALGWQCVGRVSFYCPLIGVGTAKLNSTALDGVGPAWLHCEPVDVASAESSPWVCWHSGDRQFWGQP